MADKNKKKAWGWFVNPNAGDVEKGNAMFNNATDVGSAPTSGGMGEDFESTDNIRGKKNMKSINIREELNKRDMNSCKTDFVNMYESANLSEEKKMQLVKLLSENVSNKKLMEWFDEEDEVEYDSFGDDYEEFGNNKDVYSEVSWSKFNSLGQTMTLKDALDLWWNSVRIDGKGYFKSFENSYEDFEGNELDDNLLNRKIKLNDEFDEDSDGYPIVGAIFVDEPLKEEYFTPKEQEEYGVDEEGFSLDTYDTYHHCEWCGDITPDARKELNMGWLCPGCVDTLISRGERPVFDDYGAFESLKESASDLISNEEFFNTISKEVDGADIVLGWDKEYHTFNEWVTLLLNTYKDLEQDLLGSGDYEQAKANRETVINKLLKYISAHKDLKEEYGAYKDEPYCEEISDDLERESWDGSTENGTEWNLEVDNSGYTDFDPYIADFLAREISYPVRDGHLSYRGLDCILTKDELRPDIDEDDLEGIIPDLVRFGLSRKEIDKWLRNPDRDAEIEFYVDYDILFDVDEWEKNNKEDIDLPTEVTYDFYTLVDDGIDIESDDYYLDDVIADRLSDDYGYTHFGFNYDINKESGDVYVYDIKWDLSEGLNESSQGQSEGLAEGDAFEYGGLSFTLYALDSEDEYAILCHDVEEDYDNSPAAIGYVERTANKNDVMEVIEYYFNLFMSTIGKGLHYSEHYLNSLGIKSSDDIVGKLRYAVEIQPETEVEEFENYTDALNYFNEMVDYYKNTEHVYDDELSVALQLIDDETLYNSLKFWHKNPSEDEILSESGDTSPSEDVDLSRFTNTNTNKEPLKQATFVIEDGPRYIGYDEEYSWNGWACPWFTKEEGLKIADNLYGYLTFDEAKDSFVMVNQDTTDSEYDYYVGDDIETVDGTKHLYPIGNKSWIWDVVSNYDDIDDDMDDFYVVKN